MGVISDIVVANKSDANKLCEDINSSEFEFSEMRGLQQPELSALLKVLDSNTESQNELESIKLVAAEDQKSGPWAYLLPDSFVLHLSKIADENIPSIVKQWLDEENGSLIQDAPTELLEICLKRLREQSQSAIQSQKSLFLRICL